MRGRLLDKEVCAWKQNEGDNKGLIVKSISCCVGKIMNKTVGEACWVTTMNDLLSKQGWRGEGKREIRLGG